MNVPNQLTLGRLAMAMVLFTLLYFAGRTEDLGHQQILLDISLAMFVLAAATDFLDGYLARKWDMLTDFGRIADPLVDKIIVCGSFIFFLSFPKLPLEEWMVVVIIAREFVVNGLRGFAEAKGHEFGANIWGKMKMTLQCFTIFWMFIYLAHLIDYGWAFQVTLISVWATVLITLWSGLTYIMQAKKLFGKVGQ